MNFLDGIKRWWRNLKTSAGGGFLCDTCKLSYGSVCTRPERPNARKCPEYLPK